MSKFLTPPVWYDSNGNLVEILEGTSGSNSVGIGKGANTGDQDVAIGKGCQSGGGGVAIGFNASVSNDSVVVGRSSSSGYQGDIIVGNSSTTDDSGDNIILGNNSLTTGTDQNLAGNIIIGNNIRLENTYNTIQIGSSNTAYTFKVGSRDVFGEIDAAKSAANSASGTFFIGTTKYKAEYDSSSATLNFVPATT